MQIAKPALSQRLTLAFLLLALAGSAWVSSAGAQQVSTSGQFHVIWRDSQQSAALEPDAVYFLSDDQGRSIRLLLDESQMRPLGGLLALNRQRVEVMGRRASLDPQRLAPPAGPVQAIEVLSIQFAGIPDPGAALGPEAISGPQPWVNLLCKFADVSAEPYPVSWFETEMSNTYPGLDHYWRAASEERINISGSSVVGWYTLPQPRSYYVYDRNGDGEDDLDHNRAVEDCTGVADDDVFFPDFVGINLMFNAVLDCCAWGGSRTLNLDGQTKTYRVTWEPPWGYENVGILAHEMGHGFGLPHSSGPYTAVYDSRWDVMSNVWDNCPPYDPTYGCVGTHTISFHKDILDWVPVEQKYVPTPGSSQTITLERLGEPTATSDYLMAEIPITVGVEDFYTVEVRRLAGYDDRLPGNAVILHKVDISGSRPARVVDPDGNGNPNDAGAMWLPGETFTDELNEITVTVEQETATGFMVTIAYQLAPIVLRVGDETTDAVVPGGRIDIPVDVDMSEAGGQDLANIQFDLAWDPTRLTYNETIPGNFGTVTVDETQTGAGLLAVEVSSTTGTTESFTAVSLALDAGATEGNTPITATVTAAAAENGSDILSSLSAEDLLLCIGISGLLGDASGDDAVDIVDAQQVARYSVGLDVQYPERMPINGDVDENGQTNIIDAQQIARYSIGLETPNAPNMGDWAPGGCNGAAQPLPGETAHAK